MSRILPAAISFTAAATCLAGPPDEPPPVRAALYDDAGTMGLAEDVLKALADRPGLKVERIKATEIRAGRLDGLDVLIQPGGTAGGQARALGREGMGRVREFVKTGGGYVGICAGTYLAVGDDEHSLGLLDAKLVDVEHWARGTGTIDLAVNENGRKLLGLDAETVVIHYENGPLLAPGGDPDLQDYEPLATFAGEIAGNGASRGVMPGTTAIAAGRYGAGRVLCFSPHPEKSDATRNVLRRGVAWAAGGDRTE